MFFWAKGEMSFFVNILIIGFGSKIINKINAMAFQVIVLHSNYIFGHFLFFIYEKLSISIKRLNLVMIMC
jgi:hypothetical protein